MERLNNIYNLTKKLLVENKIQYPAKAAYENFLRFNALNYFEPKNCNFQYSNFGISVIPNIFDNAVHSTLKLNVYIIDKNQNTRTEKYTSIYLPHQIYLHDLVMKKWDAEANNYQIEFEIQVIRTEPEFICFQ